MACRSRSFSQPALSLIKSTLTKPKPSSPFLFKTRSSSVTVTVTVTARSVSGLGCVQSLLPLHSAVSSARLTSCLGIDSTSSRSLSQEMGLGTPR